jgi:MFS family permease
MLGIALSSRFWGLLCDLYGFRPVLRLLTLAKVLVPLIFILSPKNQAFCIPFLAITLFVDGLLNGGMQLAFQGVLFSSTPKKNRAMYMGAANFLSMGVMGFIAPIIAGIFIDMINVWPPLVMGAFAFTGYHAVFAISLLIRLTAFPMTRNIHEEKFVSLKTFLRHVFTWGTFRVIRQIYHLHESTDEAKRCHAAAVLGAHTHPMAVGELIVALKDPSHGVREVAATALGQIGDRESLQALLANLENPETSALNKTITSLADIGHDAAILPLLKLYYNVEDLNLRYHIASAITTLTKADSIDEVIDRITQT